ncbi:MAG: fibronectin type III domain-containing protein [Myxococcota bacterium]
MICLLTSLVLDYHLDQGEGGLSTSDPLPQWEYGTATTGPMTAPVWGTRLAGSYLNDASASLEIPLPDRSGTTRPVLVVEHWYAFAPVDKGLFEVDSGSGFETVEPIAGYPNVDGYTGSSAGWVQSGLDLTGLPSTARVRMRLIADDAQRGPGWYVRAVRLEDGDPIPPVVTVTSSPEDTQDPTGPYPIEVDIFEDVQIEAASVVWSAGAASGRETLVGSVGSGFTAAIPGQPAGESVVWSVEVTDCASTTVVVGDPFRVFLAAPTGLTGPDQPHVVARSVTLSWAPPDSPHAPLAYEIEAVETGRIVGPFAATSGDVPLVPGEAQDFVVRALYDAGTGDDSEVLSLDVEVPELAGVAPNAVFPGDHVYVELEGRSLYLLGGLSSVSFGNGVGVESFDVRDVNRAVARVAVAPDAAPGERTVVLTGAQGAFAFEGAFSVLDGADAPRIVSVEPGSIVQGEELEVTVVASQPFAGPIAITTDDELLPGGTPSVDGAVLTVRIAASGRARSGEHDVILDDGERLWSFALDVDEYVVPVRRQCDATAGSGGTLAGWLLALSRRR